MLHDGVEIDELNALAVPEQIGRLEVAMADPLFGASDSEQRRAWPAPRSPEARSRLTDGRSRFGPGQYSLISQARRRSGPQRSSISASGAWRRDAENSSRCASRQECQARLGRHRRPSACRRLLRL
jgi:hypothetical protein